ncbi:MAG: radical SAM protein [Lachnospiraceae bacterium]|nr:radical SAM protein [Lachnospiraceae bacterium]
MDSTFNEVLHTTLNPDGPGAIRIHLIPPKKEENALNPSVAIINGTDILPVNFASAVILAEMIREANRYDGREIGEAEIASILHETAQNVKKVIPVFSIARIEKNISEIYTTVKQIAYREEVTTDVHYMSLGEYAEYMNAPHRMDVMVSAMTKDGRWHCNQKCVHCYAAGQTLSDEEELSTEDWKKILDKCREIGIPQVTFTGGEPTMREDLFELIRHARWFISRLNTNGIKLTEDYCRRLHEAELDSVQITFYSSVPEVHNQLVGAAQYENTVKGIDNALAERLSVSINTPLCTLNRDYIKTLEFLHEKGVLYVTCSGLITTGNAAGEASERLQLTSEELEAILREAVAYCHANGMEIAFTSPGWISQDVFDELNIPSPSCGACLSNMAVTPGGNVVPCQSWLSDPPLGNLLADDWSSIWNSEACVRCRDYSAEMTGECPLRRYCR